MRFSLSAKTLRMSCSVGHSQNVKPERENERTCLQQLKYVCVVLDNICDIPQFRYKQSLAEQIQTIFLTSGDQWYSFQIQTPALQADHQLNLNLEIFISFWYIFQFLLTFEHFCSMEIFRMQTSTERKQTITFLMESSCLKSCPPCNRNPHGCIVLIRCNCIVTGADIVKVLLQSQPGTNRCFLFKRQQQFLSFPALIRKRHSHTVFQKVIRKSAVE